jgi:hypothetical protein
MNIVLTAEIARQTYRPAAHPIVRIHLLGPMRATSYLGEDVLPRARKARAILGHRASPSERRCRGRALPRCCGTG